MLLFKEHWSYIINILVQHFKPRANSIVWIFFSDIIPENGVTMYANGYTQGPACVIAAAAGTVYRNYFAPA